MASMLSNAAMATVSTAAPAPANMLAPFPGSKSTSAFPVTRKNNVDMTKLVSDSSRVNCMQVWPPRNLKKFETLSYLPPLTEEELLKEINYLLVKGWVPCIEFEVGTAFVYRENNKSPGYYDGRYWTMWKLPMFGCTDAVQVAAEVVECKKAYPDAHIRIIGFDNVRQVQCISFIAYKPPAE